MLVVEVLDGKRHERESFASRSAELNGYIKTKASQDVKDGYCQVYVVTDNVPQDVIDRKLNIYGFFSLSPYTLEYAKINQLLLNKKKYKTVPAILLGRLAKDKNQRNLSGSELLLLALREAKKAKDKLGGVFIVTHPKSKLAYEFYTRHGFQELPSDEETLIAHMKDTI